MQAPAGVVAGAPPAGMVAGLLCNRLAVREVGEAVAAVLLHAQLVACGEGVHLVGFRVRVRVRVRVRLRLRLGK